MKQDVKLYIGDKLVEFTKKPEIIFNYKTTDLTHPTAIKNAFTKTIVLDDTAVNNEVFGNIWNVEKYIFSTSSVGSGFNANKKVPFKLYVNSELYEKGYVKLDSIIRKNNRQQYSITLYGGLGRFFFALSDKEGKKKTFADLEFINSNNKKIDMSFTINKDTIFDAWNTIIGNSNKVYDKEVVIRPTNYLYDEKWNIINFMPAYEGIPDNFSADKLLINTNNYNYFNNIVEDNNEFGDYNGYILGTSNEDLTVQMTEDIRSYLQRPVISMKSIINACQNPANNGGWELKLDNTFFNDNNPYYTDAYLTLNKLTSINRTEEEKRDVNATITQEDKTYYSVNIDSDLELKNYSNAELDIQIEYTPTEETNAPVLYTRYYYKNNAKGVKYREYLNTNVLLLQLIAYDELDNVVMSSDTHYLGGEGNDIGTLFDVYKKEWEKEGIPTNKVIYHNGKYELRGDKYVWVNDDNTDIFNFKFPNDITFSKIKLRTLRCYRTSYNIKKWYISGGYEWVYKYSYNDNYNYTTPTNECIINGEDLTETEIITNSNRISGVDDYAVIKFSVVKNIYSNFFSNLKIKPNDYLTTENSVADYLIGYAKMFGLYFWINPSEESEDINKYPNGVVHLLTRNTYYQLNNVNDLSDILDRGNEYEITPYVMNKKYYTFDIEQTDSEVADDYLKEYGEVYGIKKVETGYEFDETVDNLLNGSPYKSGIDVLEVDKYFNQRTNNDKLPSYIYNGFKCELFKLVNGNLETSTIDIPIEKRTFESINKIGISNADSFAKLQFHTNNNSAIDAGNNVLVFFNGSSMLDDNNISYYITDDVEEMIAINNDEPCYILTNSNTNKNGDIIAYNITNIPKFQRNKVDVWGNIIYSWDMATPKTNYVINNYNTINQSITYNFWDNYIKDLTDENNKKMNCYINFKEQPNAYMLRRLYWYENNFWVINEINNWNIQLFEPVNCQLVKVMDINNYKTNNIDYKPKVEFKLLGYQPTKYVDNINGYQDIYYTLPSNLSLLKFVIYSEKNNYNWCWSDYTYINETGIAEEVPTLDFIVPNTSLCWSGNKTFTSIIGMNNNSFPRDFTFSIKDSNGNISHRIIITQLGK